MDLPDQIGDWARQDAPERYDRETIFDYIDGAGEVYRSYGFSNVFIARYARAGTPEISLELFDMGTPEDAYGVFSYAREQEEPGIGGGFERKGRVLCFWQDRFYVCVAADDGSEDSQTLLEDFARVFSQQLPASVARPAMVDLLPSEGLVAHSDRFFHLHQSLNYHYYVARENVLNLTSETDAVLARYAPGSTYLVIVRYGSEADAVGAHASFREQYLQDSTNEAVAIESDKYVSTGVVNRFVVVVLDADSETAAADLKRVTMHRITAFAQ